MNLLKLFTSRWINLRSVQDELIAEGYLLSADSKVRDDVRKAFEENVKTELDVVHHFREKFSN